MVAVGMLMTWLGYSLGLEGWCLWADYDLTLGQLMSPLHPYSGKWPPAKIPDTQTWPGGTGAAGSPGGQVTGTASAPAKAAAGASTSSRIIQAVTELPGFGIIK